MEWSRLKDGILLLNYQINFQSVASVSNLKHLIGHLLDYLRNLNFFRFNMEVVCFVYVYNNIEASNCDPCKNNESTSNVFPSNILEFYSKSFFKSDWC